MKIKQILLAFLFTALVVSCGDKAKNIDVSELKTACEFVDAILIVGNEQIALAEAVDSEGPSDAQKKEWKSLEDIGEEILGTAQDLDLDDETFMACPNADKLKEIGKKLREFEKVFR
tara:strand:+ start:97 stop:447 length:351 start_codon:yes stop_codon:yes gene_type:complete